MHTSEGTRAFCTLTAEELQALPSVMFNNARKKVMAVIEGDTPPNHLKFKQDLFVALLDPQTMKNIVEWYFNNLSYSRRAQMGLNKAALPLPQDFPSHLKLGPDNRPMREFRIKGHHVLSDNEYMRAFDYVASDYPQLPAAMRLIEFGIRTHIAAVDYHIARPIRFDSRLNLKPREVLFEAQDGLYKAGSVSSVINEFLPVILQAAVRTGQELDRKLLAQGIKDAFSSPSYNTFTSLKIEEDGSSHGYHDIRTCPLKQAIGHVMNMTLETGEDGSLVRGKPAHGGLLFFAMTYFGHGQRRELVRDAGGPAAVAATIS